MVNMVKIQFSVFFNWKENFLAILTDGVFNMNGRYQGVVTPLENTSTNILLRIWCHAHKIDIVMGEIFSTFVKDKFILS